MQLSMWLDRLQSWKRSPLRKECHLLAHGSQVLLPTPQEAVGVEVAAREVAPGVRLHLNLQASRILRGIRLCSSQQANSSRVPQPHGWTTGPQTVGLSLWQAKLNRMQQSTRLQGNSWAGPERMQSCHAEGSSLTYAPHAHPHAGLSRCAAKCQNQLHIGNCCGAALWPGPLMRLLQG